MCALKLVKGVLSRVESRQRVRLDVCIKVGKGGTQQS